jgi:hypothetical protein
MDNPTNVVEELKFQRSINASTCLYPDEGPNLRTNEILNVAPAQNQTPTHFFYEKNWEAKAFPTLFPNGKFTFNENRIKKITAKRYINSRLLSKDTRFAESTEYVFQCLHWSETIDIKNSVTMALKKSKKKDISLAQLQNPNQIASLLQNDQLFSTFKNVRGSPPYWKKMSKDMFAKIQQFGTYTFFLTGSIADFHCPEIMRAIGLQYGKNFTHAEINNMTWQTKRTWLQTNPVTAARHIDYIFNQVWDKVILCEPHPIGQILNYDRRIEMQARGTAHFHSAIHVMGAPVLNKNSDEEVVKFINKYIKCQIPDETREPELHHLVTN